MALFSTPGEHALNPPETWKAEKVAEHCWRLTSAAGVELDRGFETRRAALSARVNGWAAQLYRKLSRWYAGEPVPGWKPYATVLAEHERRAAAQAARVGRTSN